MSFRYSRLCGTAFDAVDAVKLEIPKGFKFWKFKSTEFLKKMILNLFIPEFKTLGFGKRIPVIAHGGCPCPGRA
jgi:hypothetical protein